MTQNFITSGRWVVFTLGVVAATLGSRTASAGSPSVVSLVKPAPICSVQWPYEALREPRVESKELYLFWPVASTLITSDFGRRKDPFADRRYRKSHRGIDIACKSGTPVFASADGYVLSSKRFGSGGLSIKVDHGGGLITRYAHLSKSYVRPGTLVRAGQKIALSGASGRVTGPHLHFEVWIDSVAQNPLALAWRSPENPYLQQVSAR